ncbi:uroporphyrinogen-III C-methyltransferase [Halorussus sp. AFM4]|uniref:uroporphyrinogen-III C-methyltransferase n=1 Tax=Halorussus sp. AFM4 TaxID=3421651 RepID=UPI003EBD363D
MDDDATEGARPDRDDADRIGDLSFSVRAPVPTKDAATRRGPGSESEATKDAPGEDPAPTVAPAESTPVRNATTDDRDRSATRADEQGDATAFLVGAGPGDPDLLTRRAWQLLREADVVLHDSLTGDAIVDQLPASAEVLDVGKRPPERTSQDEINELLVERSRTAETVVRLKGGDPNVFGRGGEEAEHLAAEGVPFEIVPGVSSVLAAPRASGIPLTHRDCSSSLTVITGHQTPDKDESAIDWHSLADSIQAGGTLVVLMGVNRLPENVRALRDHGVPSRTSVAMVQKATWGDERTVTGTLDDIVERSRDAGIEPPAVTIIGDVVDVRDDVAEWLRR